MKLIIVTAAMLVDEKHINCPNIDDVKSHMSGELTGPTPEDYGIVAVHVEAAERSLQSDIHIGELFTKLGAEVITKVVRNA